MADLNLIEDLANHRLERLRILERENQYLRSHRAQLERLLGRALRIATKNTTISETVLLGVLEDFDRVEQREVGA